MHIYHIPFHQGIINNHVKSLKRKKDDSAAQQEISPSHLIKKYMSINDWLNTLLMNVKNNIEHHAKSHVWDKVKKLSNDYEMIFLHKSPVSRSYFKFTEIWSIVSTKWRSYFKDVKIKSCHICEAPGGFIEALLDISDRQNIAIEQCYCMSLLSHDKKIPVWRLPEHYVKKGNVQFCNGYDGTGNIYIYKNVTTFIRKAGIGSCAVVTADGGFDFSTNYNTQEISFAHMLACEIFIALNVQMVHGIFVLKIFDMFSPMTIKIVYILQLFYKHICIVKPSSSRPANSERYIICEDFIGLENTISSQNQASIAFKILRELVIDFQEKQNYLETIDIPVEFYDSITEANIMLSMTQILNIHKTFLYIDVLSEKNNTPSKFYESILESQAKYRNQWIEKYIR
jgi:23S rRNA U2552 (ribose-2'-O)-methylase RlmE/FtsJ